MSSDDQSLRLQFELERDDYLRFFRIAARRQSNWKTNLIYLSAFALAIPVALFARVFVPSETANPMDVELAGVMGLLAYFAGLIAFMIAVVLQRKLATAATFAENPSAFGKKEVVLDAQGATFSGDISHVRWAWPAVKQVTESNGLVMFWINSQTAWLVPQRAFTNAEARNAFVAFARAHLAQSA